jgi:FkbM family methyltransferase
MPHFAKKLRVMASGLPVGVCQAAISDYDGEITMAVGDGEQWATGASHVTASNHAGARLLDLPVNKFLRKEDIKVKCMSLDSFITANRIASIDFCKIDIEGHEATVLRNYSWVVKPAFMKIEHCHSPGNVLDEILSPQGYTIFVEKDDIYCVL